MRAASLLALGSLLGLVANAIRHDGVRPASLPLATSCTGSTTTAAAKVLEPEQASLLCGDPDVMFADVRPTAAFAEGHIAGAIHLPCAAEGDVVAGALAMAEGKHTLVLYGGDTAAAAPVAESLRQRLSRTDLHVVILAGGFPAWDRAGLACSSGPCPACNDASHRAGVSEATTKAP